MIACVVIAGGNRADLIDQHIVPSLHGFDEVIVVGDHHHFLGTNVRYLHVPHITKTTNDALIKRDVGALACRSEVLLFLSDDHCVLPGFAEELKDVVKSGITPFDVIVPARWADHPEHGRIRIPNGEHEHYCAGHGGVFRRRVVMARPWTAQKHHRNWDLITSHDQQQAGFKFVSGNLRLSILDLEPNAQPWK